MQMTDRLQRARKDTLQTTPPTDKTNSTKQYSRHNRAWTRLTCAGTSVHQRPRAQKSRPTLIIHFISFHLVRLNMFIFMFSPTQPFVEYGPITLQSSVTLCHGKTFLSIIALQADRTSHFDECSLSQ